MDSVKTLTKVVDEGRRVVDGVSPEQLGNPTLCTEWTVRDIINHITGGATYFAMTAEQGSVPDELMGKLLGGGDNLGDDYKAAFNAAADKAVAAFSAPGIMDKIVKLPFGEMPASVALNIAIFDVSTHNCDIAEATGQDIKDTAVLEAALEIGKQFDGPGFRDGGMFAEAQPCSDDAPIDQRLLAFAGRKV